MKMRMKTNSILILFFYLFIFQNAFNISLLDEIYALVGLGILFVRICYCGKVRIKLSTFYGMVPYLIFVFVGLLGNILYQYQPIHVVLVDLFTNLKFFLSIYTTMLLVREGCYCEDCYRFSWHARLTSIFLFGLFLINCVVPIFESYDVRYGIRSVQLFYQHPSYMASVIVFLLAILTFFYRKGNAPFIIMDLILLAFTLRGKAIGSVVMYCMIFFVIIYYRQRLKWWHIVIIAALGITVAWQQIYFYYIKLSGSSARSVMTSTAFVVAKDYFPIGTGFGTYGSHVAGAYYSPVYVKYGFEKIHELSRYNSKAFLDDTFWPIIIGQTGLIGTACYVFNLWQLIKNLLKTRKISQYIYAAILFVFGYLFISSTSEPTFNNPISIPLTIIIGYALCLINMEGKQDV